MDHTMGREPAAELTSEVAVVDPNARAIEAWRQWRDGLADALGTDAPLEEIRLVALRIAVRDLAESDDPQAWVWATVCGAEIARRRARALRPPQRDRRAVA